MTVAVLGFLFDFLFWKQPLGINFTVYAGACLVAGALLLLIEGHRPAPSNLLLAMLFFAFAFLFPLRLEPMTASLVAVMTLVLGGVLAATYMQGRWYRFNLVDYVLKFFDLYLGSLANMPLYAMSVREKRDDTGPRKRIREALPAVRGFMIAAPIFLFFTVLLASADLVFAQRIEDYLSYLGFENLPEYILRGFIIVIIAYLAAGVLLYAAGMSRDSLMQAKRPQLAPFLGNIEWTIIMASVLLLFCLFLVVQFQYFFGGEANIDIDGYTYAEYARRGFGELVAVAFFTMLLLLGLNRYGRRVSRGQRLTFASLSGLLVLSVLVIMVSAYQRLFLYEDTFGFSRLRTYTHVFIIWLAALLVLFLLIEVISRRRFFAQALAIASIGFVVSLLALNVDAFIVHHNVDRAVAGEELDIEYLQSLSDDAIPALGQAYASTGISDLTQEELGATLVCMAEDRRDSDEYTWKSLSFSRLEADRTLSDMEDELDSFTIIADGDMSKVKSAAGNVYSCD